MSGYTSPNTCMENWVRRPFVHPTFCGEWSAKESWERKAAKVFTSGMSRKRAQGHILHNLNRSKGREGNCGDCYEHAVSKRRETLCPAHGAASSDSCIRSLGRR